MPTCAPCTSRIHPFERVADGASLEAWIEGDCTAFTSSLQIQTDVSPPGMKTIPHGQLCRAEGGDTMHVEPLVTPRLYVAMFVVSFLSDDDTTVELHMCIRKADGETVHSNPLCCMLTGKHGDFPEHLTAVIKTFQS